MYYFIRNFAFILVVNQFFLNHPYSICFADEAIVSLSSGQIRGRVSYEVGRDRPVHVFKGVPFAEPPVGNYRFEELHKTVSWKGVLETKDYKAACMSNSSARVWDPLPQKHVSEDCIYVNIFADPKCLHTKSCPVLFLIHGGAFVHDSATLFNDTEIVRKYASDGVIFVIPAYRLGVFGFLDLGNDDTLRRNLGFHDMIFALKWTRNEIAAFGGDPKRITIMGNSAGGSAVAYLCASPYLARDDFQQAIIDSGVPSFSETPNLAQSRIIMRKLKCYFDKEKKKILPDAEKLACLRKVDAFELIRTQRLIEEESDLFFGNPSKDKHILPAKHFADLVRMLWQPRPLLILTTRDEFEHLGLSENLTDLCHEAEQSFGYTSFAVHKACMDRYIKTFKKGVTLFSKSESMHAMQSFLAVANHGQGKRNAAPTYVGSFELTGFTNHAENLIFYIGHYLKACQLIQTPAWKLMNLYYPEMIKRFLHGKAPDPNWKPADRNGKGYFIIDFKVANGEKVISPHFVDAFNDLSGVDFWLKTMAQLERNSKSLN